MSESTENKDTAKWEGMWSRNQAFWHLKTVNAVLNKHCNTWLAPFQDKGPLRIFFPLCGKTVDMIHVVKLGHYAVGLEAVTKALDEFASENNLTSVPRHSLSLPPLIRDNFTIHQYTGKAPVPLLPGSQPPADGDTRETVDVSGKLEILQGNLFHIAGNTSSASLPSTAELEAAGILGQFDAWFDRGSFVAIDPPRRKDYVELVAKLLRVGGRILLAAVDYDTNEMNGPPHSLPLAEVRSLFAEVTGAKFTVESIETDDSKPSVKFPPTHPRYNMSRFADEIIIITRTA